MIPATPPGHVRGEILMVGALVVFAFALAGVFYGGSGKNVGLAAISAVVGSIALLIAFPSVLSVGGVLPSIGLVVVLLAGALCFVLGLYKKSLPTAIMLILGAVAMAWATFRLLPSGPVAFQHLATHLSTAGKEAWNGVIGFFADLTAGNKKK